jgi:hypothetical protein
MDIEKLQEGLYPFLRKCFPEDRKLKVKFILTEPLEKVIVLISFETHGNMKQEISMPLFRENGVWKDSTKRSVSILSLYSLFKEEITGIKNIIF